MVKIETTQQALAYLERLQSEPETADLAISFGGDLEYIRIIVEGLEFKHSVTGELARSLSFYQDEIYKAAKFALNGQDGRFQLTQEQKKSFELVIEVRDGSTDLLAPIEKIAEGLATGISNLDPVMLTIVVISVVLILTTGYVATKILEIIHETKQKKDSSDAVVAQTEAVSRLAANALAEQTNVVRALSAQNAPSPIVRRFETAQTEGVKEVLKSVPTATEVTVGGVAFDSDDIKELRRRSPRAKSEYNTVVDVFRVFADTAITPVRLTLSGALLPGEFSADFPDDIDESQIEMLWNAIRNKQTLTLEVGATLIREKVRSAVILDVIAPGASNEDRQRS